MPEQITTEVTHGPWGIEKKANGQVEVNLPGNVMVLKAKPDETGGLYFSNGEKVSIIEEMNKGGVGVDVNLHGGIAKTEIKMEDFEPTIDSRLAELMLESWPKGSILLKNLLVQGTLKENGVEYRVLRNNGEPVSFAKNHYMYIPVKDGNITDYPAKQ